MPVGKQHDKMCHFINQGRTRVSRLCRAGLESLPLSYYFPASTDVFYVFGDVITVDVLHEYTEFISRITHMSQNATSYIDGTVHIPARLDAFIAPVI